MTAIITIGNFDGVHIGHRALIDYTIDTARSHGAKSHLLTFSPHPRIYFNPSAHFFIESETEKRKLLKNSGIDILDIIPFKDVVDLSPQAFFEKLILSLDCVGIVLGANFNFGKNRAGSIATLRDLCEPHGISVYSLPMTLYKGQAVSSTRIRNAIEGGNVDEANALLGRPYALSGIVAHGAHRGRTLGFPTANINPVDRVLPKCGVYASCVRVQDQDKTFKAITSVTQTPMFDLSPTKVESFIFDFSQDLYGKEIRVDFLHKIRDEAVFDSVDALVKQIHEDCIEARKACEKHKN